MNDSKIAVVLDNVRSAFNVGAIWRTAEAAGVTKLVLVGMTPHPPVKGDSRLPYVAQKDSARIAKTALGAENSLQFEYYPNIEQALSSLKAEGYNLAAIEQDSSATSLFDWQPKMPLAVVFGHERSGVDGGVIKLCDAVVEIPMMGSKESLNVAVAAGIILYSVRQKGA